MHFDLGRRMWWRKGKSSEVDFWAVARLVVSKSD
jgi:hypothetical protein